MDHNLKARLKWIETYEETKNAGLTCRKCGISRPTLRKWLIRYKELGEHGLLCKSRRPHSSPNKKLNDDLVQIISDIREDQNLGNRRIQSELIRCYGIHLSRDTIHKALKKRAVKPLRKPKREKRYTRYEKEIPGERIQMDVCKIKSGCYQYTSIDDCSRYRVLRVYNRRTAKNTLDFLDCVIEEMPFPIQRIQTDRGREFFAYSVQEKLKAYSIKFRPIKPASPHLNGKVERSQQTDLQEFYPTLDLASITLIELDTRLAEWQHFYNWERPHGSLKGKSPMDRVIERSSRTPYSDEVEKQYIPNQERIREQNYYADLQLQNMLKK